MHEKIGKLECLVRDGDNDKKCVVLLHGFGADASDLFPLADFFDPDQNFKFVFPEAPLEVPIGPMMTGRGWFPLTLRELEGGGMDFTSRRPPNMNESGELVYDLIFNLDADQLILGGFSQGAMIALDVALNNPQDVAGLALMSGTILDEANWTKKAPELKGKPMVMSHGTGDPVLPFAFSQKLFDILKAAGVEGSFVSFPGGHEIPLPVLQKIKTMVNQVLG